MKDKIIKNLIIALGKLGLKKEKIDLEIPNNIEFGDYSTPIALKLSKKLKKNPNEIAEDIMKNLPQNEEIKEISVIKPGFINFKLSNKYLLNFLNDLNENKTQISPVYLGKEKKVMVEFAHPNTHKLFHIGHLRNITIGESLVRIFEYVGNKVIRTNYQGDIGLHIAKCLWYIKYKTSEEELNKIRQTNLHDKIAFLGKAYAAGQVAYDEDENANKQIIEINRMVYQLKGDIIPLWKETRQWSLDYFDQIYKRLDSRFDRFYFESEISKKALEIVNEAVKKNILEKSDGAIVFNGKKYGLDTRVFVNSQGFPTYEGKELALAEKEFSEFGELDKIVHVVTPEQKSFFQVTFKVEELLDSKKYKGKQFHLAYEWVKLKTGKMSSRTGNVIEGPWLIDTAKSKIIEKFKLDDQTAETIAIGAVKYSFLKSNVYSQIAFDFDESISLEGNSGPYLLYTYVRTQSVLKKNNTDVSTMKPHFAKASRGKQSNNVTINIEELNLLRTLYQYHEVIRNAAISFSPNLIANYLFDLAQKFNLFYQKCPIIKAEENTKNFRLALTEATGKIIKDGLYLLGIKTVEKM